MITTDVETTTTARGQIVVIRPLAKISYNRKEAAAVTGVSLHTINEAVSTGELPAKKHGSQWIILAADLTKWVSE